MEEERTTETEQTPQNIEDGEGFSSLQIETTAVNKKKESPISDINPFDKAKPEIQEPQGGEPFGESSDNGTSETPDPYEVWDRLKRTCRQVGAYEAESKALDSLALSEMTNIKPSVIYPHLEYFMEELNRRPEAKKMFEEKREYYDNTLNKRFHSPEKPDKRVTDENKDQFEMQENLEFQRKLWQPKKTLTKEQIDRKAKEFNLRPEKEILIEGFKKALKRDFHVNMGDATLTIASSLVVMPVSSLYYSGGLLIEAMKKEPVDIEGFLGKELYEMTKDEQTNKNLEDEKIDFKKLYEKMHGFQEYWIWQPKTEGGKQITEIASIPFELVLKGVEWAAKKVTDDEQKQYAIRGITETIILLAPYVKGLRLKGTVKSGRGKVKASGKGWLRYAPMLRKSTKGILDKSAGPTSQKDEEKKADKPTFKTTK